MSPPTSVLEVTSGTRFSCEPPEVGYKHRLQPRRLLQLGQGILIFALALTVVPIMIFAWRHPHDVDEICSTSTLAFGLDSGEVALPTFVINQMFLNALSIVVQTPPTIFCITRPFLTWYLTLLGTYCVVGFVCMYAAILMWAFQLKGWCDIIWIPALITAGTNFFCYMITCTLAYQRLCALQSAMLKDLGLKLAQRLVLLLLAIIMVLYLFGVIDPDLPAPLPAALVFLTWFAILLVWIIGFLPIWALVKVLRHLRSTKDVADQEQFEHAERFGRNQVKALLLGIGTAPPILTLWQLKLGIWPFPPATSYLAHLCMSAIPANVDLCSSALSTLYFWDARKDSKRAEELRESEARRVQRHTKFRDQYSLLQSTQRLDPLWQGKVDELAGRGVSLKKLLQFYSGLGRKYMKHFDPSQSTTSDVVFHAIIPLSAAEESAAMATVLMRAEGAATPAVMVSHNWGNLFSDLMATIVADAVGDVTYEWALHMIENNMQRLTQMLEWKGVLDKVYWVCAFAINQHTGICGSGSCFTDNVTRESYPECACCQRKYSNTDEPCYEGKSSLCEMNKFDHMMEYLAFQSQKFYQIIAVDREMHLFTRAWVIAEIALAARIGLHQHLIPLNAAVFRANSDKVESLRVQDMSASRPEDVHDILAKIPDVDEFNHGLRTLIQKHISDWLDQDLAGLMAMLGRLARSSPQNEGKSLPTADEAVDV